MNYWHAFVTSESKERTVSRKKKKKNLLTPADLIDDVYEPFFELIHKVNENGKQTAKKMFNASGSCAHHNTDLWGDTAPQDNWQPATTWTQGLAWLVMHTYDHYLYTGDVEFLRANFQPLKDSLAFFLDFLTPYKETGWMVTNPTTSPENTFVVNNNGGRYAITAGATIDNVLIRTLIRIVLEGQELLGITDAPFTAQIAALLPKLPPLRENSYGGVMEWIEDFGEAEPGMGHISHLIGAYPLADITSANATTFKWAQTSLQKRLDNSRGGVAGWPLAWDMALFARFFQPEKLARAVTTQLQKACRPTSLMNVGSPAQFQIDANFGSAAGMVEGILQSHEWLLGGALGGGGDLRAAYYGDKGRVPLLRLLPTVPRQWAASGGGYARGLRARGGFQVDVAWDSTGKLTGANLTSLNGSPAYVTLGSTVVGKTGPGLVVAGGASGVIVPVTAAKGARVALSLA
jgi:alpha-L-fucosidase 2